AEGGGALGDRQDVVREVLDRERQVANFADSEALTSIHRNRADAAGGVDVAEGTAIRHDNRAVSLQRYGDGGTSDERAQPAGVGEESDRERIVARLCHRHRGVGAGVGGWIGGAGDRRGEVGAVEIARGKGYRSRARGGGTVEVS